ncbi:NAD-dependent deacylase [Ignavibacteria bacterium CHB1]|nr:MAG: NAD-dependent deacylase [Chlorobiota bacterium]MBV6397917.1 NAD-dependent protein deacylase [Ignavibacteria bacterium]MCC6886363.1 NAD-dependent protein deacylase [Ignavibacteriales bacterium]MCE7952562.1 NAD-dependent deacylase [Chlorobi bacterium CHB7]MDL1886676.1 NAD-dependent deacylase [Ignavibacteria bacterium CHB1]RIK48016.1 MAG: NAD-dependent protein deacylase [Ignavibacteriota bacterium]
MKKKRAKIVVLTGSGISAESGLKTFRDSDGLWEGYDVMQVASIQGWRDNKELVLDFYNERRRELKRAKPNDAHLAIAELQKYFHVEVITQNVDDLHERAGTKNVLHLHGELTKARSSGDQRLVMDIGYRDIKSGEKAPDGFPLRPHVVWFGEQVPLLEKAHVIVKNCDFFIVVGTSLVVYPAAGLIEFVPDDVPKYIIDPVKPELFKKIKNLFFIEKVASIGMRQLTNEFFRQVKSIN